MFRTTALPIAVLLGLATLAPTTAQAAGETCHGAAATIVGGNQSSYELKGTEGPDVIVTDGASEVDARGGDDLVCITGSAYNPSVDAGTGNDVVDASASRTGSQSELGAGSDRYLGSTGFDAVRAGSTDENFRDVDAERDVIDTGPAGKSDLVFSGQDRVPNADEVHMEGGSLQWSGMAAAGAVLDGGADSGLQLTPEDDEDLTLDAVAGTIGVSGQDTLVMSGFTTYIVGTYEPTGSFVFRGTDADESLYLSARTSPRSSVTMGDGDDYVMLDIGAKMPASSTYDAGAGRDLVDVIIPETVVGLDLAAGRLTTGRGRATVAGFEDTNVMGREVDVRGTSGANEISVYACRSTVHARGGADSLSSFNSQMDERLGCRTRQGRWFGNGGDDFLRGTYGPDRLTGGSGRDRVNGSGGRDVCSGEVRTKCEVRR